MLHTLDARSGVATWCRRRDFPLDLRPQSVCTTCLASWIDVLGNVPFCSHLDFWERLTRHFGCAWSP
eukprot:3351994-Pyramimonas_sp.AAC.1